MARPVSGIELLQFAICSCWRYALRLRFALETAVCALIINGTLKGWLRLALTGRLGWIGVGLQSYPVDRVGIPARRKASRRRFRGVTRGKPDSSGVVPIAVQLLLAAQKHSNSAVNCHLSDDARLRTQSERQTSCSHISWAHLHARTLGGSCDGPWNDVW